MKIRTMAAAGMCALALAALAALAACSSAASSSSHAAATTSYPATPAAAPAVAAQATPAVSVSNGSVGWIGSDNVYHPGEPPAGGLDSGADVAAVQATFTNDGDTTVTVLSWDAGFLNRNGNVIDTETVNVGMTPLAQENTTLDPGQSFTDTEGLPDGGPWATAGDRSVATANITVSNVQATE